MANYIGLIIALITVAGTIMANFFQYKKDSNKISEVKADTSEIKPQISNLKDFAKETNDCLIRNVSPSIDRMISGISDIQNGEMKQSVGELIEDLRYRKRLEESYRGSNSREIIVSGIDELYRDNAQLKQQNLNLENINQELKTKIQIQSNTIEQLRQKNRSLEASIRERYPERNNRGTDFER